MTDLNINDRSRHVPGCLCCLAYAKGLELFNENASGGADIGYCIDGLLQAATHIAAAHTLRGNAPDELDALKSRICEYYRFYCSEFGVGGSVQ